jgi:hypothetical protein
MLSLALQPGGQLLQRVLQICPGELPRHLPGLRKAITQEDAKTVERIGRPGVSP